MMKNSFNNLYRKTKLVNMIKYFSLTITIPSQEKRTPHIPKPSNHI